MKVRCRCDRDAGVRGGWKRAEWMCPMMDGGGPSGMELSQIATTQMKVSPRLVAMNHVLELSSIELQELINAELGENPALEMMDKPTCPRWARRWKGPSAPLPHPAEPNGESPDRANVEQVGTATGRTTTSRRARPSPGGTPTTSSTPWCTSPRSCPSRSA